MQRAAGGRKIDVTAMALVQAGTGAFAVRQGVGMRPKIHAVGEHINLYPALLWVNHPRDSEGLMLAQRQGEAGVGETSVSGKGRRQLGTTDGPSRFCLARAKI